MKRRELSERITTSSHRNWFNSCILFPSINLCSQHQWECPASNQRISESNRWMYWLSVNTIINKGSCFLQLNLCPSPSTRPLKLHKWMHSLLILVGPMSKMWVFPWIRLSGRNMEENLCKNSRDNFIIPLQAIIVPWGLLTNGKLMIKKRKIVGLTSPSMNRPASQN